jgi:hypothetical protein
MTNAGDAMETPVPSRNYAPPQVMRMGGMRWGEGADCQSGSAVIGTEADCQDDGGTASLWCSDNGASAGDVCFHNGGSATTYNNNP